MGKSIKLLKKSSNSGTALGWILIMMIIIMFVTFAYLQMTIAYHSLAVKSTVRKQAFFSARSVAEIISEDFTKTSGDTPIKTAILDELQSEHCINAEGDTNPLVSGGSETHAQIGPLDIEGLDTSMGIEGLDTSMGSVSVSASYNQLTRLLSIAVTAVKGDSYDSVTLRLTNISVGDITGIYDGIRVQEISGGNLLYAISDLNSDMWVTGDSGTDVAENEKDIDENTNPGTLYSQGDITQSYPIKTVSASIGSIIADGAILLDNVDNSYTLKATDNEYSIYACDASDGVSAGGADIKLTGAMTIGTEDDETHEIVGGAMTLTGGDNDGGNAAMIIHDAINSDGDIDLYGKCTLLRPIICAGGLNINATEDNNTQVIIGTETKPSTLKLGNMVIDTSLAEDSSVEIWGDITVGGMSDLTVTDNDTNSSLSGAVTISASGPVIIHGSIYATGCVTLAGDIIVDGDIIAPEVELDWADYSKESGITTTPITITGSVLASDSVVIGGEITYSGSTDTNTGYPLVTDIIQVEQSIYLYNGNSDGVWSDTNNLVNIGNNLWTDASVTGGRVYDQDADGATIYHAWNEVGLSTQTVDQLKQIAKKITTIKSISQPEVIVSSQLPTEDQVNYSKIQVSDVTDYSYETGEYNLDLSDEGDMVYSISYDDYDEDESYSLNAGKEGDTYLFATSDIYLGDFEGYAGEESKHNGYIVVSGGEILYMQGETPICNGYIVGDGSVNMGDNTKLTGIVDCDSLILGDGVELIYKPLNIGTDSVFGSSWKLNSYAKGIHDITED